MDVESKKYELLFISRMNIKLHQDLELYYAAYTRWTSVLSLLSSSAAFGALTNFFPIWLNIGKDELIGIFMGIVTLLNAVQLAFGFPSKLQAHAAFRRKWTEIEYQLKSINKDTPNAVSIVEELEKKSYQFHGEEPPVSELRKKQAFNYAVQSLGYDSSMKLPLFFRR